MSEERKHVDLSRSAPQAGRVPGTVPAKQQLVNKNSPIAVKQAAVTMAIYSEQERHKAMMDAIKQQAGELGVDFDSVKGGV